MSASKAYEKMLADGSANRKIVISQPTPENPTGSQFGGDADGLSVATKGDTALGDRVIREVEEVDPHGDYTHFDNQMQKMIDEKKRAASGGTTVNQNSDLSKITKRLDMIEKTLGLIMETHKLILEKNA